LRRLSIKLLSRTDVLQVLHPKEPLFWKLSDEFRGLSDSDLAGGREILNFEQFTLVRGGTLYALDEIDAAHRIFQDVGSSEGRLLARNDASPGRGFR
jgi:hypothetical protein